MILTGSIKVNAKLQSPASSKPKFGLRRIAVIGAGYVGLPTAVVLCQRGHDVIIAERDPTRLKILRQGDSPFMETGINELIRDGIASGRLKIVETAIEAVQESEFVFLCVATPEAPDGSADLSILKLVASEISPYLAEDAIVINKSTVPIGTAELIRGIIDRPNVAIVSNPEFLREGNALADSTSPDRVVVGSDNKDALMQVAELFGGSGAPVLMTDSTTAELIKYASNAFLAMKLTFVNSLASFCEVVGANVNDLFLGMGHDKRIGFEYLQPGPGWGGSCLPKDTTALLHMAKVADFDIELIRASILGNEIHIDRVVQKIRAAAGGSLGNRTIAVLGLTFKANTNDLRDSPAIEITQRLVASGARIRAFDPSVSKLASGEPDLIHLAVFEDPYSAVKGADAIAVLTEWPDFRWLDFDRIRELASNPSIVDARNLLSPELIRHKGFSYSGIGQ